jgi:RNA polymerase sigma factor (sigma-70 family)
MGRDATSGARLRRRLLREIRVSATPKSLLKRLYEERQESLTAFFRRRLPASLDAADLAQEVYLRILRRAESAPIDNPEAYLFTVAGNLAKEHAVAVRRRGIQVQPEDAEGAVALVELPAFERAVDDGARLTRLEAALAELSPKCRAAVLLQYRHEMSYEEIATRLGVSRNMVKKYLSQGLAHCRRRMARLA